MIIRLTRDTATLALRIKEYTADGRQLVSWEDLHLLVLPGERACGCDVGGSPLIFTGCWPGKLTDVDIANWRPDFPAIDMPAFKMDAEGRAVFRISEAVRELPSGRYTGEVHFIPSMTPQPIVESCLLPSGKVVFVLPQPENRGIPREYLEPACCGDPFPPAKPAPKPRKPESCILLKFDIDLGPECSNHLLDQVVVEFLSSTCGVDDGEA